MSTLSPEVELLENIVPKLEAEGYDVYLHPSAHLLPSFMQGYVPDAIALGSPKNLAIEIKLENDRSNAQLDKIVERFRASKDWEFRVYWVRPTSREPVKVVRREDIEASLNTIENMLSGSDLKSALLLAWATFEALGRALLPEKFVRPQTPGRLTEVLASEGYVTPSEAVVLRRLSGLRNRFIHGELTVSIDRADLKGFLAILRTLLAHLGTK